MTQNYEIVDLPLPSQQKSPQRKAVKVGLKKYQTDDKTYSGSLALQLTTQSPVMVGSGKIVKGRDLANRTQNPRVANQVKNLALVRSTLQTDSAIIIPGSSLKGVVRSIYEAITRSCICITKGRLPRGQSEWESCPKKKDKPPLFCPTCQIFGALNLQGLIRFQEALCPLDKFTTDKIPLMMGPKKTAVDEEGDFIYYVDSNGNSVARSSSQGSKKSEGNPDEYALRRGRKFYPHTYEGDHELKLRVQQVPKGTVFTTTLHFMNVSREHFAVLLIALGLNDQKRMNLKIGAGKPVGMGSISVKATSLSLLDSELSRYHSFAVERSELVEDKLTEWIQDVTDEIISDSNSNNNQLLQLAPLNRLSNILRP